MAADVYVVGVGMIKFGRYPDKDVPELGGEAALLALDDAGLGIKDMRDAWRAATSSRPTPWSASASCSEIGQTGIPVVNVANACATGSTAFREACMRGRVRRVRRGAGGRRRADGQRACSAAVAAASGIRTEGVLGLRPHAGGVRPGRHGAHAQVRHHVRAVRQGVGEEPPPLDAATRKSQYQMETPLEEVMGARDDLVPEHA